MQGDDGTTRDPDSKGIERMAFMHRLHNKHWSSSMVSTSLLCQNHTHAHNSLWLLTQNPYSCFENHEVAMAQDSVVGEKKSVFSFIK